MFNMDNKSNPKVQTEDLGDEDTHICKMCRKNHKGECSVG